MGQDTTCGICPWDGKNPVPCRKVGKEVAASQEEDFFFFLFFFICGEAAGQVQPARDAERQTERKKTSWQMCVGGESHAGPVCQRGRE